MRPKSSGIMEVKEERQALQKERLKEDTVSDLEMSFDRAKEGKEEKSTKGEWRNRRTCLPKDLYQANKGAYDAIRASASAGIQQEQPSSSTSRAILKKVLKTLNRKYKQ